MSGDQHRQTGGERYEPPYTGDAQTDYYEDEEVPTVVLIAVGAVAVLTAVLYLWLGGGHNHFH